MSEGVDPLLVERERCVVKLHCALCAGLVVRNERMNQCSRFD